MAKKYVGCKFYRTKEDGELEIIRVLKKRSEIACTVITEGDPNSRRVMTAENMKKYNLLKPNGVCSFNIVDIIESKRYKAQDVMVLLSSFGKEKDFAMCRQLIVNPFTEGTYGRTYGLSMSRDTCPTEIDYDMAKGCNGVAFTQLINIYRDDTPDSIMALAKSTIPRCDKVLKELKQRFKDEFGFCSSLKELLEHNSFWEEYDRMFGIKVINDIIKNNTLSLEQLTYLETEISYLMDNVIVVPYGYDINLNAIKSDYMLIRDKTNQLYLVSYLRGTFLTQEHMSEEEIKKFTSIKK